MGPSATIGRLFDRLGYTLLRPVGDAFDPAAKALSVCLYDHNDFSAIDPQSIVLGLGVRSIAETIELIEHAARAEATALIVRESFAEDEQVVNCANAAGVVLLNLVRGASWMQVAEILTAALGIDSQLPAEGLFGDGDSDLFDLANSIAVIAGGPVTIEDLSSRIIAYSADQDQADHGRKESVLGRRVPHGYSVQLLEQGVFRRLYASASPIFMEAIAEDLFPRVAVRLHAGGEILGSIWVVTHAPLNANQNRGLVEAANVVALAMLRARVTSDTASRVRTALVARLIEGGASATDTAHRSGFPFGPCAVTAFSVVPSSDISQTESDLQRLSSSLDMHLRATRPSVRCALIGDTVYAVHPLRAITDLQRAQDLAAEFISRTSASSSIILAGIGSGAENVGRLGRSRSDADLALRVLRHRADNPDQRHIATIDDIQAESLILRMREQIEGAGEPLRGALLALIEYDDAHDAGLVATLRTWLDTFGDVNNAADQLHIHKNTFRYRLRRLVEIGKIDLSDPEARLGLMLQLRLFHHRLD